MAVGRERVSNSTALVPAYSWTLAKLMNLAMSKCVCAHSGVKKPIISCIGDEPTKIDLRYTDLET